MSWFKREKAEIKLPIEEWTNLESLEDLPKIIKNSKTKPIAFFKHSTRCSISRFALKKMVGEWEAETNIPLEFYFLDLLEHRDISNEIAQLTGVMHQSPQLIVVDDGTVTYHNSHDSMDLKLAIKSLKSA